MKKIIISLTLIGALSITPISMLNKDNTNDKVNYKKTFIEEEPVEEESVEEESETSILVEDKLEPRCNCESKKCPNKNKKNNES